MKRLLPAVLLALAACKGFTDAMDLKLRRDPISIQNGIATRDYAVSYDRACSACESGLRNAEVNLSQPPVRIGDTFKANGTLKDGRPVEVSITRASTLTRVAIKVGAEDTNDNRAVSRSIHARIEDDFQVVRRTYNTGFDPVWQATQKSVPTVENKVQPDATLGQVQGKKQDGTPVIITIQRTEDGRTRITVEVGASSSAAAREDAVKIARAVSDALGVKAEEDK
jgi:hypothetical protein